MPLIKKSSVMYDGSVPFGTPLENMNTYYNTLDAVRPYRLGPHHAMAIRQVRPELMDVLLEGRKPYGDYLQDVQPHEKLPPWLNTAADVATDTTLGALSGAGAAYLGNMLAPGAFKWLKGRYGFPALLGGGWGAVSGFLRGRRENDVNRSMYDDFDYAMAKLREN